MPRLQHLTSLPPTPGCGAHICIPPQVGLCLFDRPLPSFPAGPPSPPALGSARRPGLAAGAGSGSAALKPLALPFSLALSLARSGALAAGGALAAACAPAAAEALPPALRFFLPCPPPCSAASLADAASAIPRVPFLC